MRDDLIKLMSEHKIGTSVHFIPLHMQPYWKNKYNLKDEDFPNATKYYQGAISLPIYTKMTANDQMRVILALKKLLS